MSDKSCFCFSDLNHNLTKFKWIKGFKIVFNNVTSIVQHFEEVIFMLSWDVAQTISDGLSFYIIYDSILIKYKFQLKWIQIFIVNNISFI